MFRFVFITLDRILAWDHGEEVINFCYVLRIRVGGVAANIPHIVIAGIALAALLAITLISWYYRRPFITHYPRFSRQYDLIALGFSLTALAKVLFLPLDFNDARFIQLEQSTEDLLGTIGNILLFLGLFSLIFGWAGMIASITRRYELVPVVKVGGEAEEASPGVYLIPRGSGLTILSRLIKGRAPVIITRTRPDSVRKALNLKEAPVLWLTTAECGDGCVNPRRLEYLLHTLVTFMQRDESPKVVYLDGIEYLTIENGFVPVYKFLLTLKDYAIINNTLILTPIDKSALGDREWKLLKREFVHWTEGGES
jgi:hypothetical protein